jgi:hypothetical protein
VGLMYPRKDIGRSSSAERHGADSLETGVRGATDRSRRGEGGGDAADGGPGCELRHDAAGTSGRTRAGWGYAADVGGLTCEGRSYAAARWSYAAEGRPITPSAGLGSNGRHTTMLGRGDRERAMTVGETKQRMRSSDDEC